MDNLVFEDLTIEASDPGPGQPIRLSWLGKSNHRQPGKVIGPYLLGVATAAGERKVPVEMHFERLDYFNSSSISTIIQFIQEARARSVRLVILYNPALRWQRLSFDALRVFSKGDNLLELKAIA